MPSNRTAIVALVNRYVSLTRSWASHDTLTLVMVELRSELARCTDRDLVSWAWAQIDTTTTIGA